MKYQAVIFDLFGTLVENFSIQEHKSILADMASVLSAPPDDFAQIWIDVFDWRTTGFFQSPEENIAYNCRKLGVHPEDAQIKRAAQIRHDFTLRSMTPRADAIEVLSHLKSKGYKIALISDCSAEVPAIWEGTPFAPFVDVPVFSCSADLKKPDPRIYRLATEQLAVEPVNCLYVGDGSSQELTGASGVGMHPVLIRVPGEEDSNPYRINAEDWYGPAISSLKEVLDLVK